MINLHELVEERGAAGTRAPVTADSLFRIAPITKVWTATLVQEFVNEGRLDLDRLVRDVLPGFRPVITPRHLLTHTSGIDGDLFHDTGSGGDAVEEFVARPAGVRLARRVGAGDEHGACSRSRTCTWRHPDRRGRAAPCSCTT